MDGALTLRVGKSLADKALRPTAARQLPEPRDLMVHCAQEMNHLAGFLPALYDSFSDTCPPASDRKLPRDAGVSRTDTVARRRNPGTRRSVEL